MSYVIVVFCYRVQAYVFRTLLNQYRLLQVATSLEIELLNDSREVHRQDLGGTGSGVLYVLYREAPPRGPTPSPFIIYRF